MLMFDLATLLQDPAAPASPGSQAPPGAPEVNPLMNWVVLPALLFAVFYFFMIAPDNKRKKKHQAMLQNLPKGAKVMTSGGLYGTVTQVQDQIATLQIAEGVRIRIALSAIQQVLEANADAEKA